MAASCDHQRQRATSRQIFLAIQPPDMTAANKPTKCSVDINETAHIWALSFIYRRKSWCVLQFSPGHLFSMWPSTSGSLAERSQKVQPHVMLPLAILFNVLRSILHSPLAFGEAFCPCAFKNSTPLSTTLFCRTSHFRMDFAYFRCCRSHRQTLDLWLPSIFWCLVFCPAPPFPSVILTTFANFFIRHSWFTDFLCRRLHSADVAQSY